MLTGYARVSTGDQNLRLQRTALKDAGCKKLFEEKRTGKTRVRLELTRMLEQLRPGDVIIVLRLDRLARSTRDLLTIAEELSDAKVGLRSLHETWLDTTTPAGRMIFTIMAGIAQFERELIGERTSEGRVAAKARGVRFGRPLKLSAEQLAAAAVLIGEGKSVAEAARVLSVSVPTLYRRLAAERPSFVRTEPPAQD